MMQCLELLAARRSLRAAVRLLAREARRGRGDGSRARGSRAAWSTREAKKYSERCEIRSTPVPDARLLHLGEGQALGDKAFVAFFWQGSERCSRPGASCSKPATTFAAAWRSWQAESVQLRYPLHLHLRSCWLAGADRPESRLEPEHETRAEALLESTGAQLGLAELKLALASLA